MRAEKAAHENKQSRHRDHPPTQAGYVIGHNHSTKKYKLRDVPPRMTHCDEFR